MKIIISPAKKMNDMPDILPWETMPVYLEKAEALLHYMKSRSFTECRDIWKCNEAIAKLNYDRFSEMDLRRGLTPAVLSYEGIQYRYMRPGVMEGEALKYLQKNLRILSGFYGILKPFDGVAPYRLEMQARLEGYKTESLYGYWGNLLAENLLEGGETVILNLASKEYASAVVPYLKNRISKEITCITCVFGESRGEKIVQKGTFVKMARGEMVRYLAENQITQVKEIKSFNGLGYQFLPDCSDEKNFVFGL